jgi:CheY-like chemotaxis protein
VLIVEDEAADLYLAADVVKALGFTEVEARKTITAANAYLQSAMDKRVPQPGLIILDLDLGYESGHELLRFWHSHRDSLRSRMLVWTKLDEHQQDICKMFGVDAVVSKWQGVDALKAAIKPLAASAG